MGEEEIYFGKFPGMGKRRSFVINDANRLVVTQLHRSPGICFEEVVHASAKLLQAFGLKISGNPTAPLPRKIETRNS
jgi:DNA-directed RNA polymerase beta subunit